MNTLQRCIECTISVKCGELLCGDVGQFGAQISSMFSMGASVIVRDDLRWINAHGRK
jgi:hypothetical protein